MPSGIDNQMLRQFLKRAIDGGKTTNLEDDEENLQGPQALQAVIFMMPMQPSEVLLPAIVQTYAACA